MFFIIKLIFREFPTAKFILSEHYITSHDKLSCSEPFREIFYRN